MSQQARNDPDSAESAAARRENNPMNETRRITDHELRDMIRRTGIHSNAASYRQEAIQELAIKLLAARKAIRLAMKYGTNTPPGIVGIMKGALLP